MKHKLGAKVRMAHGNGGRFMRELIQALYGANADLRQLQTTRDAALLPTITGKLVLTTDSFTVYPLQFPGGDIGKLAACGTINDLAVAGADPLYASVGLILEEGLEIDLLLTVLESFATELKSAGVALVTGDTKVVPSGKGGGIYINVTGLGVDKSSQSLEIENCKIDDDIIVTGTLGNHGAAVLLAREEFGMRGTVQSDCASVYPIAKLARELPGVKFMRDPTRGGVATVCHEIVAVCNNSIRLYEEYLPIDLAVNSLCAMLAFEPLYMICEGRVVIVVNPAHTDALLSELRAIPGAEQSACVGKIEKGPARVVLQTSIGGERILQELEEDPLPRIC